jgi:signal transduction histidine kinase/ActR/RegA family two-component response regulator
MGTPEQWAASEARDRNVRDTLPLVAGGLAGLYLALAATHAWFLTQEGAPGKMGLMVPVAGASAAGLAGLRLLLRRGVFGVAWAQPLAFAIMMVVLLNCAMHLRLTADAVQSTNFMLLLIGASCVLLSVRWLAITMSVTWVVWLVLAIAYAEPKKPDDDDWRLHFAIGLAMSTIVGAVIHALRVQSLTRFDRLIAEQRRTMTELLVARDAARNANRAKSEFLANMSHELRTPLNSVVGTTELLLASPLDPRQRELARTLHRGAETLLSVISNLLDISKSEAGRLELDLTDFELSRLIGGVVDFAAEAARAKGLRWHWRSDVSLPERVRGDELRLRQVLVNLLENAVKFTESGEVGLSLRLAAVPAGGWMARFVVRDTGPGLAPELQAQLFRPFTESDALPGNRTQGGSLGLGLGVCRQLVELMGGRIGVNNNESGRGSEFWVEVPLRAPSVPVPVEAPVPPAAPAAQYRVLVAEPNEVNQVFARRLIEGLGHDVSFAADAEEVMSQAVDEDFDIILMDLQLPGIDGFESARRLRERLGSGCPRIVGVTSQARVGDRERCLAGGMDDYLTKPLRRSELVAVLARTLGGAEESAASPPTPAAPGPRPA